MEKDLELNQDFFLDDNVVCKKKVIIQKRNDQEMQKWEKITAHQKLNREIFLQAFLTIV